MLLEFDRLVPPSLFCPGTELGMDSHMEEAWKNRRAWHDSRWRALAAAALREAQSMHVEMRWLMRKRTARARHTVEGRQIELGQDANEG